MAVIEYTFSASRDERRLDSLEHLGLAKKVGFDHFSRVSRKNNLFLLVDLVIQRPTKKADCFHFSTHFSSIYPWKNKQFCLSDKYENWLHILRKGEEIMLNYIRLLILTFWCYFWLGWPVSVKRRRRAKFDHRQTTTVDHFSCLNFFSSPSRDLFLTPVYH